MALGKTVRPWKRIGSVGLGIGLGSIAFSVQELLDYNEAKGKVEDLTRRLRATVARNLIRLCATYSRGHVFHRIGLPYLLVSLGNSENYQLHAMGVKSLAVVHFPSSERVERLKIRCKPHLLISLARTPGVSPLWFSADTDTKEAFSETLEQLEQEFTNLLRYLDRRSSNTCTLWMINEALQFVKVCSVSEVEPKDRKLFWSFGEDTILEYEPSRVTPERKWRLYLETLRHATNTANDIDTLVRKNLIGLLKKAVYIFEDNVRLLALLIDIVANLALNVETHSDITSHGFVKIAKLASRHAHAAVSSAGQRLLYNLDLYKSEKSFLPDGIHLMHPTDKVCLESTEIDVVFVHGLTGGPFWTWRQQGPDIRESKAKNSSCWPKDWLAKDLPSCRIFCVEYNTHLTRWSASCPYSKETHTLEARASELVNKLTQAGIGERPIIWVTHSMGGLVVKDILTGANYRQKGSHFLDKTFGIVFFSVPHKGSPLAKQVTQAKFIANPSVEVVDLQEGSKKLTRMHENFMKMIQDKDICLLSILESKPLELPLLKLKVTIVPFSSAHIPAGKFIQVDRNHVFVCKPKDKEDPIYTEVLKLARNVLRETKHVKYTKKVP